MEDLYVDMKEYLKYVLDKNTDREQYIKCYHMLLCFLKECIYICLYAHTPHTHTHTHLHVHRLSGRTYKTRVIWLLLEMRIRGMRIKNGREIYFLLHIKRHNFFFDCQPGYCNANQFSFSKIKQNWHNTKPKQGRGHSGVNSGVSEGGHSFKRKC